MTEETPTPETPEAPPNVPPPPSRQAPPPLLVVQAKAPEPQAPLPPPVAPGPDVAALDAARKAAEAAAEAAAGKVRELEAAQAKAAAAEVAARRQEFVSRLGGLIDDAVWASVPDADPATDEGQRTLVEFFQRRPTLLKVAPQSAPPPISEKQRAVQMSFGRVPQNAAQMLGPKP